MDEICEIIPSQKGNNKINIRGYLMVKDKEREGKFYWCCEKRKSNSCNGRAVTILLNNQFYLIIHTTFKDSMITIILLKQVVLKLQKLLLK